MIFKLSAEQEKLLQLLYDEVEIAIKTGNSPFAAIITDAQNQLIAKTHNQANTKNACDRSC